jgi:hypothetical protein
LSEGVGAGGCAPPLPRDVWSPRSRSWDVPRSSPSPGRGAPRPRRPSAPPSQPETRRSAGDGTSFSPHGRGCQAQASLQAAALDDADPPGGGHPGTEPVRLPPVALLGLKSSLDGRIPWQTRTRGPVRDVQIDCAARAVALRRPGLRIADSAAGTPIEPRSRPGAASHRVGWHRGRQSTTKVRPLPRCAH